MKNFLKGKRGKQILVSALAVGVIASGYYRWATIGTGDTALPVTNDSVPVENTGEVAETPSETDFFALSRYERDCARSEAVEILSVAAEYSEDKTASAKKIEKHNKNAENEVAIEDLVRSKGFEDCVAFVDDDEIRVIVKAMGLESKGVEQIKDIVVEVTGAKPTAIKISNRN